MTDSPGNVTSLLPVGWPDATQDLTSLPAAGSGPTNACEADFAKPDQYLCLPNPDFWASAARAFAQLLAENPKYVTQARLDQLQALNDEGSLISGALHRVSANDAGSDVGGTGNKLLDNAINYYDYWGANSRADSPQPSLYRALRNEERRYLSSQGDAAINPWGGINQNPDTTGLLSSQLQDVPPCPEVSGVLNNPNDYNLPYALNAQMLSFLPSDILNAARLGVIQLSACYTASFSTPSDAQGGPFTMSLRISDGQGGLGKITVDEPRASYCNGGTGSSGNPDRDGIIAVAANCNPTAQWLTQSTDTTASGNGYSYEDTVDSDLAQALSNLQTQVYEDIISGPGGTLTTGDGTTGTNVQAAAQRLGGANALLNGYVSLGLPQALASDDVLHSYIAGQNADAFAPTQGNTLNVQPATDVPTQVVNLYRAAITALPVTDATGSVVTLIENRGANLANAVRQHIVPTGGTGSPAAAQLRLASGLTAASSSTDFAEDNPLIGSTKDRLSEAKSALTEAASAGVLVSVGLAGPGTGSVSGPGLSCSADCSYSYTAVATFTDPHSFPSVTLTATPAAGSSFAGWSGACTGTGQCILPIGLIDQAVTARFVPAAPGGTVTSTGSGTPTGSGAAPGSGVAAGSRAPVRCTLTAPSGKVLLPSTRQPANQHGRKRTSKVKPGTVTLTLACNQAARVTLAGTLAEVLKAAGSHAARQQHVVHFHLGPARGSAPVGRRLTLTIKLPAAALQALARKTPESAVFTASAVNANGTSRASTKIAKLTPTR